MKKITLNNSQQMLWLGGFLLWPLVLLFFLVGISEAYENVGPSPIAIINAIKRYLVGEGFENVVVKLADGRLFVEYENRRYRYEMTAMGVVIGICIAKFPVVNLVTVIPKNRDIPLVSVTVSSDDYRAFIDEKISAEAFSSRVKISQNVSIEPGTENCLYETGKANSTLGKFDFILGPGVKVLFGNYDDPFKLQLNAIPEISTTLAKGMSVAAQLIIPLQNELEGDKEGDEIRPGRIVLNQVLRFPHNLFTSVSLGYFDRNRYGLSAEAAQFLANGSLSVGVMVGYTGSLSYLDNIWHYSDIDTWMYLLNWKYRFPHIDFSIDVTWGRFLHGDTGWRMDLLRSFRETDIGFFGIKTTTDALGGFKVSIPIFPFRRLVPKIIRASPPVAFPWTYRYRCSNAGRCLSTGYTLDGFFKKLNPVYIRSNVGELKSK